MARYPLIRTDRARAVVSWSTSVAVHVAAGVAIAMAPDWRPWEYDVASGRPIAVEFSSASRPGHELSTSMPEPIEMEALENPVQAEPPVVESDPIETVPTPTRSALVRESTTFTPDGARPPSEASWQPMLELAQNLTRRDMPEPESEEQPSASVPRSSVGAVVSVLGAEVDELPRRLPVNRAPVYPLDALLAGIQGRVMVRVLITAEGRVARATVEDSSGSISLDDSALTAIRGWRFLPARRFGLAVQHEVLVPVKFTIRNS